MAIPFPQTGGHILGQPFSLSDVTLPVSATLTCNCAQPPSPLSIVASAPAQCPACRKTYVVAFNPQNGQLTIAIAVESDQVPS
jgi:hypothetical protein